MCTLVLAWQVFEDAPVVVAANRDEYLDRPSEPPAVRHWGTRVLAPMDAEAGGTWLGYNEHGVLVGVTNRWLDDTIEGERSRGLLVRDALGAGSGEDAVRYVERELDERDYAGFNLVAADDAAAILVEWDGTRHIRNFEPGVHVVVNVGADGIYSVPAGYTEAGEQQMQNAGAVRTALQPEPGETSTGWLDRAAGVISDHEYGVCIHRDSFGTRSSSLIAVGTEGVTYQYADGPPCETPFEHVSPTL
ncbi:hypothetical protein BRC65_04480 [Halobacteriales archaeon QH_2_65_14]|nr:MAG: hypothetical protein BRC65_04480 [Halobacteriales archaeon QH_2_65_14]